MNKIANLRLKNIFSDKRFSIPFSVLLAFSIWLIITLGKNQTMDRTITVMGLGINLDSTVSEDKGLSIIGDMSKEKFTVAIHGPSNVVSRLTAKDINLFASTNEVDSPGVYSLKVAASNTNFEIISITPSVVDVTFDYIETEEFNIVALAEGASAEEGLIAEAGVVGGTESDTISITGPRSVINKINKVTAYAQVNRTLKVSETFDADIILYDENGDTVSADNLTLSATKVKVTVPISKKKTVPVVADYTNLPNGFDTSILKAVIDHDTVTIIGTPEVVDKTNQITLSAIDVATISPATQSFDISAKLPDGIRLLDSIDHFTVTLDTSGFAERVITVSAIKYKEVASGLSAGDGSAIKNVKICGPKSVINKLDESKAYAEVFLTDKTAGAHTVSAKISFDGYTSVWAEGKYDTTITLK